MSRKESDVVIVSGCRTPIGKFGGALKDLRAYQLAGIVMKETLRRAGVEGAELDEVIAGDCVQAPDEAKLQAADFVIDNSGTVEETKAQVKKVYDALLSQAKAKTA